ncbi:MAG TPA: XRE family transcriptional regulator [Streptosporangiaceae bacterium]|jgi:transcriptional regulator with XRE-family HTH domain|nr:XRE family transcriptional regulator [Streptosporangiaceae bacterium]
MSAQPSAAPEPVTGGYPGRAIRDLRHRRELTLVQLAERTGLSHSFLSQLERGLAQPSMRSLHRIAQALRTSQDRLMAGQDADDADDPGTDGPPVALLRAGEGATFPMAERDPLATGSARQLLAGPGNFYATEFTNLGRDHGDYFEHGGNEFLYIAEGRIEVDLAEPGGARLFGLGPGDSLRYPGTIPHRWRAADGGPTRVLMVHTDPRPRRPTGEEAGD